ncbi:hypothetical protein IQ05_00711 [Flavobacterium tiangeerense]|uniref:Uncharacterized protein n=1 Tax=Flavobacterium tiangeerense TaxID=459471 RepID=A0ABY3FL16_9FLAO|nr:hypothetical protein [Flavobacterium tiangeerense]TWI01144.1 hypothetical protein IQ05_00711 [Flavobacterium tiangeerense]
MKKITQQKNIFIICISILFVTLNSYAKVHNDTILKSQNKNSLSSKFNLTKKHTPEVASNFHYNQQTSEFTKDYLDHNFPLSQETQKDLELAKATIEKIEKNSSLTDFLEPKKLSMLPIGIKKTIGGIQYMLGISKATFKAEYTELTAFVRIIIPQKDANGQSKQLFFGANNIKLSHKGGLVGDTNLALLGDVPIKINGENLLLILKGGMNMATGEVDKKTYVTIDCNGFKELGITADLKFSRNLIVPVNDKFIAEDKTAHVTTNFKTVVSNWNDILVEISMPKFELASKKGFCFELNNAVLDFSDLRNSKNVNWPVNYEAKYLIPGNENLWRGIYVETLNVVLPEEFKKKNSKARIHFNAKDLLIDRMGVSGHFLGTNLISLDESDASGWEMSLDSLDVKIAANSLVSADFNGEILLPVSDKTSTCSQEQRSELKYKGSIDPIKDEYILNAQVTNDICFQAFKATATIKENSYVELKVKDGKFFPKAVLFGTLSLKASNKSASTAQSEVNTQSKETVDFKGIIFENLTLQTVTPYLTADYFGYKNLQSKDASLSNFPVTVNEISLITAPESASLKVDLAINIMENQFTGQTKFYVIGKFGKEEGIQKWKYDSLKFEQINIGADIGGMKLNGSITIMDNDPVYGKGFKGMLSCDFTGGIKVEANAIFGATTFRYWYVDAMADNLNIPSGAITFKGFGGGASYRMKKEGFSNNFTASGSNYVPDIESGLGVKAMIKFSGTASADAFWGGAGFEIAFNNKFGINRISIYGEGHVMQPFEIPVPDKLKKALKEVSEKEAKFSKEILEKLKISNLSKAAEDLYPNEIKGSMGINAFAAIQYDFTSKILHGTFDMYVNTPGGLIKGRGSNNRAGWAVLHFGPDKWYIHMGTPKDRLGLKMAIGPVEVESGGYFMMGDDLPGSPPPPAIVADLLGLKLEQLDYMRDENSLSGGKGFAFGSDFSIKTGDITFLLFYANFQAGFGFDIMVKDYGDAACQGSGPIGINGWYANGQAYAYLKGELGIKVKLFMVKKKIKIIEGGGAVLVQAKMPNPVWIRGYLGGHFNLLGGLVKGRFRFKVEFGKECEFINNTPLNGLKAIADITPAKDTKDVNVFAVPQVGFNMPINKNFTIEEDSGLKTYRLKLEEFLVKKNGNPILGSTSWNTTNDLVSFNATEVLPQNSDLTLSVKVSFQEYTNGNWKTIYENGQIATENETVNFTTGTAPNNIPVNNIAYCYPVFDQKYVYQNESKQAYVVLKQGQSYLFELKPGQTQKAFYKTGTKTVNSTLSYSPSLKKVSIDIPVLEKTKSYNITLMTLETQSEANNNLKESYETQNLDAQSSVETKKNELKETITGGQGIELLQYNFNTSQYNTFEEKMNAKRPRQTLVEIIYSDVHALHSINNSSEPFDEIELIGNAKTLNIPLVTTEAILDDNYYINEIFPLIYKGYPLESDLTLNRNTNTLGIPPTKGVETLAWYQDDLMNNATSYMLKEYLPYRYNLPFYFKTDFVDLRYKVVNKYLNTANQVMKTKYDYIINGTFPYIKKGNYNIKLNYTLPGGQLGTSSIFTFNKTN